MQLIQVATKGEFFSLNSGQDLTSTKLHNGIAIDTAVENRFVYIVFFLRIKRMSAHIDNNIFSVTFIGFVIYR